MGNLDLSQICFLFVAAFFAGGIDAMVGGGGLIQLPSLLITFPDAALPTLFGTNKLGSAVGTASSALRYLKEVTPPKKIAFVSAVCAFIGSFLGANFVAFINPVIMRPIVIALLVGVAAYTVCKPKLGDHSGGNIESVKWARTKVIALSLCVGFYDGFFGPGTGTFFLFGFVVLFHADFITASALSKIANLSTNCAALFFFLPYGHIAWEVAGILALGNLTGSVLGTSLAVKKGAHFVRIVFLCVVTALTARLSYLWFW